MAALLLVHYFEHMALHLLAVTRLRWQRVTWGKASYTTQRLLEMENIGITHFASLKH